MELCVQWAKNLILFWYVTLLDINNKEENISEYLSIHIPSIIFYHRISDPNPNYSFPNFNLKEKFPEVVKPEYLKIRVNDTLKHHKLLYNSLNPEVSRQTHKLFYELSKMYFLIKV